MNPKVREQVFKKYQGRCAYCGSELEKGWHVDHINPKIYGGGDEIENLNPACKDCNLYKGHSDIDTFREYTRKMCNTNLERLFKSKTKMNVAIKMGAVTLQEWDGVFYFEKLKSEVSEQSIQNG